MTNDHARAADERRQTAWEFACGWYTPEEIHRSITEKHYGPGALPPVPVDVCSKEFADWLTEQYRLAMAKGIDITRQEYRDALADVTKERDAFSPLKPPSDFANDVFAKTLENNPNADMRAIPHQWLLDERATLEKAVEMLAAERDELRDEGERRDAEYLQLRARYDEAKAEVARLSKMLHTAQDAACKSIGELSELRTRHNDLAAINGRLVARLEATPSELEAAARIRQARAASDSHDGGYPATTDGRARSACDHVLLAESWLRAHPLPEGERVGAYDPGMDHHAQAAENGGTNADTN